MKTVGSLLILLLLAGGTSYERLTEREEALFYRSRGKAMLGRRLHLHLPPTPFLNPPENVRPDPTEPVHHQYVYRNVKFIVHPGNPYYQQFRRKRKTGKIVCLKGEVVHFPQSDLTAVRIHRIRGITLRRRRGTRTAPRPPAYVEGAPWLRCSDASRRNAAR
jgi:hypothetical protein